LRLAATCRTSGVVVELDAGTGADEQRDGELFAAAEACAAGGVHHVLTDPFALGPGGLGLTHEANSGLGGLAPVHLVMPAAVVRSLRGDEPGNESAEMPACGDPGTGHAVRIVEVWRQGKVGDVHHLVYPVLDPLGALHLCILRTLSTEAGDEWVLARQEFFEARIGIAARYQLD
jgi:hypothetical protein